MQNADAVRALAALAQPTRLGVFRLLVRQEPIGVPATMIAKALNVANNTMSLHLNVLIEARLVSRSREGRNIIYRAEIAEFSHLMLFLVEDCCQASKIQQPLLTKIQNLCPCE